MAKLTLSALESTIGRALVAAAIRPATVSVKPAAKTIAVEMRSGEDRDRAAGALLLAGLSPVRGPGFLLTVRP